MHHFKEKAPPAAPSNHPMGAASPTLVIPDLDSNFTNPCLPTYLPTSLFCIAVDLIVLILKL